MRIYNFENFGKSAYQRLWKIGMWSLEMLKLLNFQIVGEDEANVKINKIAYNSPLAKVLIGNALDDKVVWIKPSGNESLTIVNIQYKL